MTPKHNLNTRNVFFLLQLVGLEVLLSVLHWSKSTNSTYPSHRTPSRITKKSSHKMIRNHRFRTLGTFKQLSWKKQLSRFFFHFQAIFFSQCSRANICVGELGKHWFRLWIVACLATNHYLNKFWIFVNWIHRNKLQWHLNRNKTIFSWQCIWKCRLRNSDHFVLWNWVKAGAFSISKITPLIPRSTSSIKVRHHFKV